MAMMAIQKDIVMQDVQDAQLQQIHETTEEIREEYNRNLRIDLETVRKLLTLLSNREELLEKDREFLRSLIVSLTDGLYQNKMQQADIYLVLAFLGGILGIGGAALGENKWGKIAHSMGSSMGMAGNFSNQFHETSRMHDESSRQLRYGDHSGAERTRESVQTQLQRILETLQSLEQMKVQASRMR